MPEDIQSPINAFPEYVQQIICHYSEAKGYPIEYFIQAFLAATSTALGRSVTLHTGNFTAIGSIWAIILGEKGYTKSEPLDDAFKPIRKRQFELLDAHRTMMDEFNEYKANHPKDKSEQPPDANKHVINDTTPEKLILMLAANPKGIGMVYDEISGFVGRFNRYNNGGDEQMFLTLFNGTSAMRDRINGQSAYAKHTYLTIAGTTQPSVLKEVFLNKSENGFFDRWIITQPDGFKKQYPNQFGINYIEEAKYNQIINSLLAISFNEESTFQMRYSPESYKIIFEYQCYLVDEQNNTDDGDYRGMLAKMEIYLHKFSLLLQAIIFTQKNEIEFVSVEAAEGAIILTKYYIEQAKAIRLQNPIEKLKNEWPEVYKSLPSPGINFTRNEFVKKCAGFALGESIADKFLRTNADRSEKLLFFKVKQGIYTKNLF